MMKHLIVTEATGSLPITNDYQNDALTAEEADELQRYANLAELDHRNLLIDRRHVRFINYVGYIQLSTCSIEILPKVIGEQAIRSRRVLLRMLQRSGFLDVQETDISDIALENATLYEILGFLMASKLKRELIKGPNLAYITEEDHLTQLKGKVMVKQQLKNEALRSSKIYCQYDHFSMNTQLNQVFKAAINVLMRHVLHRDTQKILKTCYAMLDEVDLIQVPHLHLDRIRFDRTNQRFSPSFSLAKLILTGLASTSSRGREPNFSILFKMNDLFEAYIASLARQCFKNLSVQDKSHKLLIREETGRGAFQLVPDIVINQPDGAQVIMDTKWKLLSQQELRLGVSREDMYQMYAYLTSYKQAKSVILLYPHHEGLDDLGQPLETWYLEEDRSKKLKIYTINYEYEEGIIQSMKRMAT